MRLVGGCRCCGSQQHFGVCYLFAPCDLLHLFMLRLCPSPPSDEFVVARPLNNVYPPISAFLVMRGLRLESHFLRDRGHQPPPPKYPSCFFLPYRPRRPVQVMCMSRAALSILPCRQYEPRTRVESLAAPPSETTKGIQAAPVPGRFIPPPIPAAAAAAPEPRPAETPTTLPGGGLKVNGVCAAVGAGGEGAASGKVTSPATTTSVTTTGSTVDRVLAVAVSSLSVVLGRDGCCDGTGSAEAGASNATASAADAAAAAGPACVLSGAQLEQAMGLVLAGIYGVVAAARLRWSDVANLRVYYHAPVVAPAAPAAPAAAATTGTTTTGTDTGDSKTMHGTRGGVDEEMIKRATFLALAGATKERPAVTFVPARALDSGAAVSVHATAWDLDRLRTELWVRGAA